MKVIREEESFKPVTIVLESQDELDWLFCCLAGTSINNANKIYRNELGSLSGEYRFGVLFQEDSRMYAAVRKLVEGK